MSAGKIIAYIVAAIFNLFRHFIYLGIFQCPRRRWGMDRHWHYFGCDRIWPDLVCRTPTSSCRNHQCDPEH